MLLVNKNEFGIRRNLKKSMTTSIIRDIERALDDNYLIGNIFNYFNIYKYVFEKGPLIELKAKHNYTRCMRQMLRFIVRDYSGRPILFAFFPFIFRFDYEGG